MAEAPGLPVQIGDLIAAKYRVERMLGAGAMGVVVAAMHLDLQEMRAIKLMLPSALSDAEAVERFLREARAAARLKSDHVAKIHDVGRLETGSPYIVLELLDGVDLKALLDREPVLSIERAARYVGQACDAIGEAHALGIVHRDLKPANLFLTTGPGGEGRVKVLDFGIAKMADPAGGVEMTSTTAVLGTPLYMSPEQLCGARNADPRSDVWALGVVLYRMVTGRVPFLGSTITEICSAVISDIPRSPGAVRPDLPPGFEALILRCLEKAPVGRFANASELGSALAPFASGTAVLAMPGSGGSTVVMGSSAGSTPAVVARQMADPPPGFGLPPVPPPAPPGSSTTQSTSWAQPAAPSAGAWPPASTGIAPPKRALRVPLSIRIVAIFVVFLGWAGWAASRFLLRGRSEPPVLAAAAVPASGTGATTVPVVKPAVTASAMATAIPTATVAVPHATTAPVLSPVKSQANASAMPQNHAKPLGKLCDRPYVVDSAGRRKMRPECL